MFSENIINLTCCIIIKMQNASIQGRFVFMVLMVDKFSAGRTKCRSPMFLKVNLQGVLKPSLGLDLIEPRSSCKLFSSLTFMGADL